VRGGSRIFERILDLHLNAKGLQLADDLDHLRIADVDHILLECESQHRNQFRPRAVAQEAAQALACDARSHGIVDAPSGQDDVGMIARLLRAKGEVIGIDTDAVSAHQTRCKVEEIPFGGGRGKNILGVDAELLEDGRARS